MLHAPHSPSKHHLTQAQGSSTRHSHPHVSPLPFFFSTFSNSARLICGSTPPKAIVARIKVSSSSSPRMASCRWRGVMRLTLRSLAALPASSRTSAVRYSRTAVTYTAAVVKRVKNVVGDAWNHAPFAPTRILF